MTEQLEHNYLKGLAREHLKSLGFTDDEINEEYLIMPKGYGSRKDTIRVDVVGIKQDVSVAIECGKFDPQKIAQLNLFFDEVIVLPYMNSRLTGGIESDGLKRRLGILEEELRKTKEELKEIKRTLENERRSFEADRENLGEEFILGLKKFRFLPRQFNHMGYGELIIEFEKNAELRRQSKS